MSERKLAFIYSPAVEQLGYPADCPFKTQRATLTRQRLMSLGLLGTKLQFEVIPEPAARSELEKFHTPRYLNELQRAAKGDLTTTGLEMGLGGPDTPVFPTMYDYSALACGASLKGAELILTGEADVAFNLLGGFHHAMPESAAGFCYLNDVVLACERLATAGKRVFYLDIDAHHADGVQAAFYNRNDVMTVSLHETGRTLFPWAGFEDEIGSGPGLGYNVNLSLPPGTFDEAYLAAFNRLVPPLLSAYNPDVIVLELGMDTLAGDPLTHLQLTNNVHVEIINQILSYKKPVLVLGGGGYNIENTVRGWALAWLTFSGQTEDYDASAGFGGVMLGSTEWTGGLRDLRKPVSNSQRQAVEQELRGNLRTVIGLVFPLHGISIVDLL